MMYLDMERRRLRLGDMGLIKLQGLLDLRRDELLNLLRGAAHEGARVEEAFELTQDGAEELGAADALEQVVVLAVLLDIVGGLVGEDAYGDKLG